MSFRKETIGACDLYLADCRELLGEIGSVDLVLTDPPYGTGGWRRLQSGAGANPSGTLVREDWDDGATDWISVLAPTPIMAFWPPARMPSMMEAATAAGYAKVRLLYMRKLDPKPQVSGRVAWSVEPIVCLSPDGFQLYGGTDFCEASTPRLNRDHDATGHPYQKPLGVMLWLLKKTEARTVLDPFMGSATTLAACVKLGRRGIGVEADPKWFDVACKRIEAATRQPDLFIEQPRKAQQLDLLGAAAE